MTVDDLRLSQIPAVKAGMLIRRPPGEVFQAFADPAGTTRFWFTKSTGAMRPGAVLRWEWEMFGVGTEVRVLEVEEDRRIRFTWGEENPTTVEFRFVPWREDATYVQVTESGISGSGDEVVARIADATGGFYQVLCAAKALLEHGAILNVVLDHVPPDGLAL